MDQELAGSAFADEWLSRRVGMLMEQLSNGIGRTIPLACGDWAATKAAYRFLDNDHVSEAEILAGHFQATRERFAAVEGAVLVLHDTTELSYTRKNAQAIGLTHKVAKGHQERKGRQRMVGEIDGGTGRLVKSYTWDPTCQGGVGGLLAVTTFDPKERGQAVSGEAVGGGGGWRPGTL
jgi:hypothetical protein